MLTVFVNRAGTILRTYPDADVGIGDKVEIDNKVYSVVEKMLIMRTSGKESGFYSVTLEGGQ